MLIGCLKARVVPVNVNHHYSVREIRDLLDYIRPRGIIYHRSLGIAHAQPETSLFIDDRQQNLTPARSLGMNVIHFESALQLRSDLERFLGIELSGA